MYSDWSVKRFSNGNISCRETISPSGKTIYQTFDQINSDYYPTLWVESGVAGTIERNGKLFKPVDIPNGKTAQDMLPIT